MTDVRHPQYEDLWKVLTWLRDVRARGVAEDVDPWAFRQALVMTLELDTMAAVERGVSREGLERFDKVSRMEARKLLGR